MKLNNKFIEGLAKYSESGMGYQNVNIKLIDGTVITGLVVLNGEELIMPKDFQKQIREITVTK